MRIFRLLAALLVIFVATGCPGQTTAVTGQVTDTDGQTWNNGSYKISFLPVPGKPGPYFLNGNPFTPQNYTGALDSTGHISITLPSSCNITPAGSQWTFTISPNATAGSFSVNVPTCGGSQNLTSTFSANAAGPRFPAITGATSAYGYLDIEISPTPVPGGQYFNVTTQISRVWNGTTWQNITGAGSCASDCVITDPSGNQAVTQPGSTTLSVSSLNGWMNPTLFSGSDIGAKINAAYAANSGCGTVIVPPGIYNYSTTITMSKTCQVLIGSGNDVTELHYTGSGDGILHQINSFNTSPSGGISNIRITGTSSGANGIHTGSVIGSTYQNVIVYGFTNGNCININNVGGGFYERNTWIGVEAGQPGAECLRQVYVKTTTGTNSLGYNHFVNLGLNVAVGKYGIYVDDGTTNIFWYGGELNFNCNAGGGECMHLKPTANLQDLVISAHGENDTGDAGYGIHLESGAQFVGCGTANFTNFTASIQDDNALISGSTGGGFYLNCTTNSPKYGGTIASWHGSGVPVNLAPLAAAGPFASNSFGYGIAQGANINSPFVNLFDAANNYFSVRKTSFGTAWNVGTDLFTVDRNGAAVLIGTNTFPTWLALNPIVAATNTTGNILSVNDNFGVTKMWGDHSGIWHAGSLQLLTGTTPCTSVLAGLYLYTQVGSGSADLMQVCTKDAANVYAYRSIISSGAGITLTTTGSSGAATLTGTVLNIPVYSGGGGSGTVTASPQFQIPYYSAAGTSNTVTGDSAFTTDGAGTVTVKVLASTGVAGAGGGNDYTEGTAATGASGHDIVYADSTAHCLKLSNNNGSFACLPKVIAQGTIALATSAIGSGACQTVTAGSVNSVAITGLLTTDNISWTPNGSLKAITGYVPSTSGGLSIEAYPTSGNANWDVCNWTSGSITPGAVTLNYQVAR